MRRITGGVLLLASLCCGLAQANWWILGTPAALQSTLELKPTTFRSQCRKLHYLVERQRELCGLSANVLQTVGRGAKLGIEECQHQFLWSRWNCSTFHNSSTVFGGILVYRSREKAYVHAVSSAAVAHSVTRACSRGDLPECGCDPRVRNRETRGKWTWGGCSDDARFGAKFSKDFVDSSEEPASPEGLMNMHNNEAGRRALRSQMEMICKCHGMSGSCTTKVCWRKLKSFRAVGDELSRRFDGATHVRAVVRPQQLQQLPQQQQQLNQQQRTPLPQQQQQQQQQHEQPIPQQTTQQPNKRAKLRPLRRDVKKPTKKDLVYLEESPDYCRQNASLGVLGTGGRLCNVTSYDTDGCRQLCCGRGYQTIIREVEEKCNCKFVWCCKVECQVCRLMREEHYCK